MADWPQEPRLSAIGAIVRLSCGHLPAVFQLISWRLIPISLTRLLQAVQSDYIPPIEALGCAR